MQNYSIENMKLRIWALITLQSQSYIILIEIRISCLSIESYSLDKSKKNLIQNRGGKKKKERKKNKSGKFKNQYTPPNFPFDLQYLPFLHWSYLSITHDALENKSEIEKYS